MNLKNGENIPSLSILQSLMREKFITTSQTNEKKEEEEEAEEKKGVRGGKSYDRFPRQNVSLFF